MSSDGRGRHRGWRSPETRRWLELAPEMAWLDRDWTPEPVQPLPEIAAARPPARPPWLDPAGYGALLELREGLA